MEQLRCLLRGDETTPEGERDCVNVGLRQLGAQRPASQLSEEVRGSLFFACGDLWRGGKRASHWLISVQVPAEANAQGTIRRAASVTARRSCFRRWRWPLSEWALACADGHGDEEIAVARSYLVKARAF